MTDNNIKRKFSVIKYFVYSVRSLFFILKQTFKLLFTSENTYPHPYRLIDIIEDSYCLHIFHIQIANMNKLIVLKSYEFLEERNKNSSYLNNFSQYDICEMMDYARKDERATKLKYSG